MESVGPVYSAATIPERGYSPPWADLSIIGIAGSSGSGKTSVAMEIVKSLNLPWVVILVMDSFYKSLTPEQHKKAHANEFDFDHPDSIDFDSLVQCLRDLKQGKKVDIPVYSFVEHQRQTHTTPLYSPHVLILEGILALHDPRIMELLDVKIFVEADMDVCLGRRVLRDVKERGREIDGIIKQWFTYVKPSYKHFVEPQRSVSGMVVQHIQRNLEEKSEKHSATLQELRRIASDEQLSPNVVLMPQTTQFVGINTILQNPDTEQVDFVFYFDRLAALLIEKALDSTSYSAAEVETPQHTFYNGLNQEGVVSAVAVLRGGSCLETALKRTIPDCITGRVLIRTNERNEEPQLHYLKLPPGIEEHTTVMLLDSQMSSGGAALMAVRVLIDHGVAEEKIVFVTPAAADPRFANIQSDPRYRLPSKRHTHTKLDKRFAHILHDKDFSRNAAVDRYGRKLARDDTKKHLERFYRLEDEDEEKDGEDEDEANLSVDDDEEVLKELKKADSRAAGYDPARDGGFSSSSEEESGEEEEEDEDEEIEDDDELEFPDKQQADVAVGEVTDRIAVVNLDWDNIRAEDLMAVFSSFTPTGGRVLKVAVYPSEFGKERMEKEETEGPPKEIFAVREEDQEDDEGEEEELDSDEEEEEIKKSILKEDKGEEFNSTKLRKYQLERLRYYYAILTFSSKDVAKHVYDNVDGAEYLTSANFFDLRFVPDDTDFTDDQPRDECERIPDGYQPNDFVTDALQHSKVKLTWDMDDKSRKEAQARAFRGSRKEIDENDLKAYLASDSSDDEEEGGVDIVDGTKGTGQKLSVKEEERQRMRALLGLSAQPAPASKSKSDGPVGEMEVTFTSGLAGGPNRDTIFENEPEETSLEKYKRKERERKKRRKEKLKGDKPEDAVDNDEGASEEKQQEEEDLGFNDPFFNDPSGKASAAANRKEERRRKRAEREAEEAAAATKRAELELLMMDDDDSKAGMRHFDMNEIAKAEKQARKKKGKRKGKDQTAEVADNFEMDVSDPRFSRLFQNHEFAIDPTNPRFKATSGMKALLEEGRKRRRDRDERGEEEEPSRDSKKQKQRSKKGAADNDDLARLVDKVKRKTKA
ncbi:uridine kinase family-domain-containing protein [Aspergillus karnatakaensis]|uniref:pre-rRNA-processing protein ESF1 n=1 Tax=Aspergillus karnatakaensis TaxID=1810916 RepID=UPI003CCD4D94